MIASQKYIHNAISSDSPPHFQNEFSAVFSKKHLNTGKRIIQQSKITEVVPRRYSNSLPPMNHDQDFDSVKFSIKNDILSGIKDSIRYKSNFYKNFFEGAKSGFKKPPKEITFIQPVAKILRNEIKPLNSLIYRKSIAKILENLQGTREAFEVDPGNKLLSRFESEDDECRSPQSTLVNFVKTEKVDMESARKKMNGVVISSQLREFEKNIPEPIRKRGNFWYANLMKPSSRKKISLIVK